MPTIQWRNLPPDLLGRLFDRAKERNISKHSPEAPAGRW